MPLTTDFRYKQIESRTCLGAVFTVAILAATATVLLPSLALARDTLDQANSTNFHLGGGPIFADKGTAFGGMFGLSVPLEGMMRGLHFEVGLSGFAAEAGEGTAVGATLPMGLRYNFLTGIPLLPYARLGTGYYVFRNDGLDHGLQLFNAGVGFVYYLSPAVGIGLGADWYTGMLSLTDASNRGVSWLAYGLRVAIAP